ncbi:MAG: caspase family protein [Bacteroidota bacterium]
MGITFTIPPYSKTVFPKMPPASEEKDRSTGFDLPTGQSPTVHPIGDYYLFVIAVDDYHKSPNQSTFPTLNNPVLDASRVVDVLTNRYTFHKPNVGIELPARYANQAIPIVEYDTLKTKCLYNKNATFANIRNHLKLLKNKVKPDDCVLIYFAGHGVEENEIGFIVPFDGAEDNPQSWMSIGYLTSFFGKYEKNKIGRHLLLVLDSCYSGIAFLGDKREGEGDYSRAVLVSSGTDQKASDGRVGEGSPFANAFYQYLCGNSKPITPIVFSTLEGKFDKILQEEYGGSTQKIAYKQLPMDSGSGRFPFKLREQDKPDAQQLAITLIKYLNFEAQKGELKQHLVAGGEEELFFFFSIVSSWETQAFLRKVLIQKLEAFNFTFPEDVHLFTVPMKLMEQGDIQANLWQSLQNSMNESGKMMADGEEQIVGNIIDLLKGPELEGMITRPVIIVFECAGTPTILDELLVFCKKLADLFLEKKRQIAHYEKLGKLFVFLADNRADGNLFKERTTIEGIVGPYPKIIVNSKLNAISIYDVRDWKTEVQKVIKANLIANLVDDYFFPPGTKPYLLFDFIDALDDYCYQGQNDLYNHLIDFEKSSF